MHEGGAVPDGETVRLVLWRGLLQICWSAQAKLNQCCCFCSGRHLADYTDEPPPTQHTHTSKPSREGHKPRVTQMHRKETTSAP